MTDLSHQNKNHD